MIRNTSRNQKAGWVLFLLYLALLVYFMFFAESFGRVPDESSAYRYNLELFREIKRFIHYRDVLGTRALVLNLAGNVVGFIPCGFFLPIVSRRSKRWYNTFLLCFGFSLCIEVTQLALKVGSFDVDDLLLNTIGGIIGYGCYRTVQAIRIRRIRRRRRG
ncbi:MAG: VanZ family protein [Lachnospiraceae bacterium]